MKAVSVLLCLVLAHGISASIFKQQDRLVDDLDVKQLDIIDQNQRQHRNQPSESEKKWDQHRDEQPDQQRDETTDQLRDEKTDQQREQYRYVQHKQQRDQQREQQRDQQRDHKRKQERDQQRDQQPQTWDQPQNPKNREQLLHSQPQQYEQYQQPAYYVQYYVPSSAQQSAQQSQEQYATYKQSQHSHHKQKTHRHPSSSSSSSESYEESKERRHYHDNQKSTSRSDSQKWESPLQAYAMNQDSQMNSAMSDSKEWKNLQMTVGPDASVQDKDNIEMIFRDAQKAMKHITEEDKAKFHQAYELAKQEVIEDAELNATQLAQKYQYPIEEHTIKTDDGYVLTVFRIPPKKHIRDVQKKPVVFLMHGLLGSADDWLLMGPEKSLPYLLSDAGYDVWLGNARGNKYSKAHVSKSPAVSDFWQYSIDEIALHDLPAMIDYALETTKQEKLYYIGHSQGTTVFFGLTATRPEYNDKIIMMYALSPMVYMTNVRSPLFRMIAPTSKFHERLQHLFGKGAFSPNKALIRTVGGAMLEKEIGCEKASSHVSFVMAGVNVDGLDAALIPVVMRHLPAGTSTKVIRQYGQAVASNEFRKFDYGPKINEKVYGKEQPPKYDMVNVQAPVTLFYSEEDWLAHPKDVERLANELPNVRETNKVTDEHFSNMDFQFSKKAPEMVYRRLIESMQNEQ